LGIPVDVLSKKSAVKKICSWIESDQSMKLVVTAYSEFFVQASRDECFFRLMRDADMVTPDGVSVLAATLYLRRAQGKPGVIRALELFRSAGEILGHKVGDVITGVWLFEELSKMASKNKWRVFLLGGWNNVSEQAALMLRERFPGIIVEYDSGEEHVGTDEKKNREVINKINKFRPDILFVSYNPVKQEKWLDKHRSELRAKIGIGVGGTFDEYVGKVKKAPMWMERMGLKWLWRLITEPKRIKRIVRAVVVFPWLLYKNK